MERGLYAAASGLIAQQTMQDVLAGNIANASTVGFKQDNATFQAVHGMAISRVMNAGGHGPGIGEVGMGVANGQVATDWQSGPITQTGNALDASLDNGQFFAVQTPGGERYTRAGGFHRDGAGALVTANGLKVLDVNGKPIQIPGVAPLTLDTVGNVLSNNQPVARLKIVQADTNGLAKEGDTLFVASRPTAVRPAARPGVRPNTLEQSNVNTVRSMVQLITVTRGFDMAQRALLTHDDMLKHAANDIGRV